MDAGEAVEIEQGLLHSGNGDADNRFDPRRLGLTKGLDIQRYGRHEDAPPETVAQGGVLQQHLVGVRGRCRFQFHQALVVLAQYLLILAAHIRLERMNPGLRELRAGRAGVHQLKIYVREGGIGDAGARRADDVVRAQIAVEQGAGSRGKYVGDTIVDGAAQRAAEESIQLLQGGILRPIKDVGAKVLLPGATREDPAVRRPAGRGIEGEFVADVGRSQPGKGRRGRLPVLRVHLRQLQRHLARERGAGWVLHLMEKL